MVMAEAPRRVVATARWSASGVDISTAATLHYADGRVAQMSCAMDAAYHRHATIIGSEGTVDTEYLNHTSDTATGHPHGYQPSQLSVRRGTASTIPLESIQCQTGSGFRFAAEAFARLVATRDWAAVNRARAASLDIAATLNAIAISVRNGEPVDLVRGS